MTSAATTPSGHPIVEFTDRLRHRLGELAQVPAWSMSAAEQRAVLVDLHRAGAQLEELRLRVLAAADRADVAADTAATSTGSWLAHATTQPRGKAHAEVTLARALDARYPATRDALAAGLVDADQARVIVAAVQRLHEDAAEPVAADPSIPDRAEKHLITLAADHDARALTVLGRHLLEVLDPDAADTALGKKLDAQEQAAARKTYLQLHDNGDGTHTGRFKITTLSAAILVKALETFTNPSRATNSAHQANGHPLGATADATSATVGTAGSLRRSRPELLGHAFAELLERLDPATLPTSGGLNATVVITLDYDSSSPVRAPPASTPANTSPRARPEGSPARPGSSPPSSAASSTAAPSSSTWAANAGCTPNTNASPWPSNKVAAPPTAATDPPPGVTPTTTPPGTTAATPTSTTDDSSAPTTTAKPTPPATTSTTSPTATSGSTGERDRGRCLASRWQKESRRMRWVPLVMGLVRSATVIGIAKVIYDQARKPENQARIRSVIEQARSRRTPARGAARERRS